MFSNDCLWWARLGLNQRPPRCQRGALPLSYAPLSLKYLTLKPFWPASNNSLYPDSPDFNFFWVNFVRTVPALCPNCARDASIAARGYEVCGYATTILNLRDQFDAAIGDLFDDQPGSLLRFRCDFNSPRQFHQSKGSTRLP